MKIVRSKPGDIFILYGTVAEVYFHDRPRIDATLYLSEGSLTPSSDMLECGD